MTKPPIFIANWKMNLPPEGIEPYLDRLQGHITGTEVIVAPPAPYLNLVKNVPAGKRLKIAAQNAHWEAKGPFTGEISVGMAKQMGASYVMVGHSERRQYFGETDEIVNKKIHAVTQAGLIPILCIGENGDQREKGSTEQVLKGQLKAALAESESSGAAIDSPLIIAYEPVWAIGTGKTATPKQAQQAHQCIRQVLDTMGIDAHRISVLYGGSVKSDNAADLMAQPDIDGCLVGGASLDSTEFVAIVTA